MLKLLSLLCLSLLLVGCGPSTSPRELIGEVGTGTPVETDTPAPSATPYASPTLDATLSYSSTKAAVDLLSLSIQQTALSYQIDASAATATAWPGQATQTQGAVNATQTQRAIETSVVLTATDIARTQEAANLEAQLLPVRVGVPLGVLLLALLFGSTLYGLALRDRERLAALRAAALQADLEANLLALANEQAVQEQLARAAPRDSFVIVDSDKPVAMSTIKEPPMPEGVTVESIGKIAVWVIENDYEWRDAMRRKDDSIGHTGIGIGKEKLVEVRERYLIPAGVLIRKDGGKVEVACPEWFDEQARKYRAILKGQGTTPQPEPVA